jgi:SAM-dependent methyltransferase
MVRVARVGAPPGVGLKVGRAEALPFRDGSFERVTMRHAVHLVDRPRAFAEAVRVLGAEGRLAIATFAPEHFDGYWLNPWFPSIAELDRARFPTEDELREELRSAGLGTVAAVRVSSVQELDRETALARVRGRHISTFDLLSDREIAEGTRRAEAELPARISAPLEQLLVVARTAWEHD